MLNVVRFAEKPTASWRPGKFGRLHAAASVGNATKLTVNESWNDQGVGAPTHYHPDGLEEVIMVLEGTGEFWVDGVHALLEEGDLIILQPYCHHGFKNVGEGKLHVLAIFSSAQAETIYDDAPDEEMVIGGSTGDKLDETRVSRKSLRT